MAQYLHIILSVKEKIFDGSASITSDEMSGIKVFDICWPPILSNKLNKQAEDTLSVPTNVRDRTL